VKAMQVSRVLSRESDSLERCASSADRGGEDARGEDPAVPSPIIPRPKNLLRARTA